MQGVCGRSAVVAALVMGLCLPLVAEEPTRVRAGRSGERPRAELNEEGRAIMEAYREQQREQMQAQARARREERVARRAAMTSETDPYTQLDLLEAHVKARQASRTTHQAQVREARQAAYAEALAASGVAESEREQILAGMQRPGRAQQERARNPGDEVLAEITRLREDPDLTTEAVRRLAMRGMGRDRGAARVGPAADRGAQGEPRGRPRPRGRRQAGMAEKPAAE